LEKVFLLLRNSGTGNIFVKLEIKFGKVCNVFKYDFHDFYNSPSIK